MAPVSQPGVLWVSSMVARAERLSNEDFNDWYLNVHVDQVVATGGVPSAARYEAVPILPPDAKRATWAMEATWLTIYELPSLAHRYSPAFTNLDGQSKPDPTLLDRIFRNAKFETRFYEHIETHEAPHAHPGPGTLVISAALTPAKGQDDDFNRWYHDEHMAEVGKVEGYLRTRRYRQIVATDPDFKPARTTTGNEGCTGPEATILDCYERRQNERAPAYLALHEFDAGEFDMEGLAKADETEWSKRIVPTLEVMQAGFFRLIRPYGKFAEGSTSSSKL
ncbi:hypothetical protein LTS18_007696 [Coniosporium uncinatum]|uniref:Uncharacterized protein n=1 Tax=Coniosporium uncinatum TaxID=93489 RepID=A0ACC3DNS0_9PEZI|nr:hypothetical protein LTS18_007696 [Coniosporium uncinatum]